MLLRITTVCNEGCSHCMVNATPDGLVMSSEIFVDSLEFIAALKPLNIQITGGEPTLHPSFFTICKALRDRMKNSIIILESNGSFIDDETKYEQVKELVKKYNILLQVRTHPEYYPNYKKIWGNPKIKELTSYFYDDAISLSPFGRALENHQDKIKWNQKPCCSNMFLLSRQTNSLNQVVSFMESHGFFCKPLLSEAGDIYVGEVSDCVKLGTVKDSLDAVYSKLRRNEPCDKCKLCHNIPDPAWKVLWG